jgi:tRNA-splicing endonuclease subunit Sen34
LIIFFLGLIHITNTSDGAGWNYPQNAKERDRCTVFEHLWAKGYYVTCGTKFGGDFLVYPGDPARYHSHYVVTVVQENDTFDPRSLVATGRLGSNVKKTQVKACVSRESVQLWSVQWAAI